jgi:WD40 repeat protein
VLLIVILFIAACTSRTSAVQVTQTAFFSTQISLAQEDAHAGRYDLARQRLEYIQELAPRYPGITEKLAQIPTSTATRLSAENATSYVEKRIATVRAIQTASATPLPPLPTHTSTPAPTIESQVTRPAPALLGTSLPDPAEPIGMDNYERLSYVGQWGKGNILGVTFAPDGSSFVVGSAFGMAVYDVHRIQEAPRWILFEPPFVYQSMLFSEDGKYILLEAETHQQIRRFADGAVVPSSSDIKWQRVSSLIDFEHQSMVSLDGTRKFVSRSDHEEENWNVELSIRQVFDQSSNELLYELPDKTMYVYYEDHTDPEGCDLSSFSMCGNVYDPSALVPYRVAFSPDGGTLGILYRAWNLWNSNRYSILRIYDAIDGKLLNQMGSFQKPIETFTYADDGRILIGYVNGSIELWNAAGQNITYTGWHFGAPIESFSYTSDGNYVYIQREGQLEVRRTSDGALFKRYDASIYALSPVENLAAIGDHEGNIRLQYLNGERSDLQISAHTSSIYALEFSPDGKMLVSAGQDCAIRAWDVASGQFIHPFEKTVVNAYGEDFTSSRIFIKYFRFIPGTKQLLGFGSWGTVVSWNINSGATNYVTTSEALEYYQGMITLNPHFPEFFAVDQSRNVFYINSTAHDLNTGKRLSEYSAPQSLEKGCTPAGPRSRDGKLLFTIGYEQHEGEICILDASDAHLVKSVMVIPADSIFEDLPPYNLINWIFLSPDGRHLIVDTVSGTLLVYQIAPQ